MPKTIRSRTANNGNTLPISNVAGHDTFSEQIKQLINASIVYTKDVILSSVITDYETTTTQENLAILNNILNLPHPKLTSENIYNTPPVIFNNEINYVSENIETEFLTLRADETVGWNVSGRDAEKFELIDNKIKFKVIPDYENPNSTQGTNIYSIRITAKDNNGLISVKILTIIVQDRLDTLPPPPGIDPDPIGPETDLIQNINIFNNISNINNVLDTITITSQEISTYYPGDESKCKDLISEQDLKDLYNELVQGFLVKGPLYLPPANIVNGLYKRIKESIEENGENINLYLYRDIIDILFKTKNIFIHNIGIEKQLKIMRRKYKNNLCSLNELKEQLKALDPTGEKGLGFEGSLGIKMRKFKPAIYHQALFNLPIAWYIYLHDTTDIVPSLYYMTIQYLKQFNTKEDSYNKLMILLDEKYLLEDDDLDTSSSSSSDDCGNSSDKSTTPCGSSSSSETESDSGQIKDDCSCEDKVQYDDCGNPIIETDDCGNPIIETDDCGNKISNNSCSDQTFDESNNCSSISTNGQNNTDNAGVLGYFYDEKLNNAIFFISGSFSLTQTKKSSKKPKTERKRYYPKRKTRKVPFAPFGNPTRKTTVRNNDGTYSLFLDGNFEIILKKRYRCPNKRKTKKHYSFCSLNHSFKNY